MSVDLYGHLPPWKRPTEYNDPPEPETPSRPDDVDDDEPRVVSEFGIDDDDELDDELSVIDDDFAQDDDRD